MSNTDEMGLLERHHNNIVNNTKFTELQTTAS